MGITVSGVTKTFGSFAALHGIDLDARPGEFLALLGPSGSGKTTLLRIIAGLDFPDGGTVAFDGADVTGRPVAQRGVGFVFQQYALFRHMTIADNIAFGLTVRPRRDRPAKAEIARRVAELLDLVQLPGLGGRYPAQLSGGQRQRVALARALAVEPRFLLLDEPFGALDAKVRKDLRRWLRGLHDRLGLTSIFVTHDQEEALELADRVVVMDHGVIEQVAAPAEIYDRPASAFVFGFVGESNCLPVTVRGGRAWHGAIDLGAVDLGAVDPGAAGQADGAATAWFRPHDIVAADDGIPATVLLARPKNGVTRIEARIAEIEKPFEADLATAPAVGATVRLRPTRFRLFPA